MRSQTPPPAEPELRSENDSGSTDQPYFSYSALIRSTRQRLPKHFGFWVLMALAAMLLSISEATYRETRFILQNGRSNADSRSQSQDLLRLLSQLDAAKFAYIATKQPRNLQQFKALEQTVPQASQGILAFFRQSGTHGTGVAEQVTDLTRDYLANANRAIHMAERGDFPAAAALAGSEPGRALFGALNDTLTNQFLQASSTARHGRQATDHALLSQRMAIAALTLLSALSVYLLLQQIKKRDRRRDSLQSALVAEREHLEVKVRQRTARLTELASHLQSVIETERAHLARELHDELGALLSVCKLDIARAQGKVSEPAEVMRQLKNVSLNLNKGIALKRRIIEDLRPSTLTHLGLTIALENLCRDMGNSMGMPVHLSIAPVALPPDAELSVYRFVQEALTNVSKYAAATSVVVLLTVVDSQVAVAVTDNGVGFDTDIPLSGHHGLAGMQFRAESLGGAMHLRSAPDRGTTVCMEFPESQLASLAAQTTGA